MFLVSCEYPNFYNEENDLKAIYEFIRYLGPGGQAAPDYVPPDREPGTPYALFPSPPNRFFKNEANNVQCDATE